MHNLIFPSLNLGEDGYLPPICANPQFFNNPKEDEAQYLVANSISSPVPRSPPREDFFSLEDETTNINSPGNFSAPS